MLRYETLILTVPEITKDESDSLEKDFARLVKDHAAELISYERWGKYRLSYPVRKNEYGVYFLARFEREEKGVKALLDAIHTFFKIKRHEIIMRSMNSVLPSKGSLTYQRPQSLEEFPTRSRDTMQYLKEARAISRNTDKPAGRSEKPSKASEKPEVEAVAQETEVASTE